jgi:hypothetical protein
MFILSVYLIIETADVQKQGFKLRLNNELSYTATPQYAFMVRIGTTLPSQF